MTCSGHELQCLATSAAGHGAVVAALWSPRRSTPLRSRGRPCVCQCPCRQSLERLHVSHRQLPGFPAQYGVLTCRCATSWRVRAPSPGSRSTRRSSQIAKRGHQAVFRLYLDYPTRPSGIPAYLLKEGLKTHSYSDYNNTTSVCPNYDDPRLRAAMVSLITALGRRYDGDRTDRIH